MSAYKVQTANLRAVCNYKPWHLLYKMHRLVTLLMLRSPKFCSNFNQSKNFNRTTFL